MSQEHLIYYASNNGLLRKHHGITLEMNAVLLSMLEHANQKTGEICVGVNLLKTETELHGKSIDKAIDKLISNGVIERLPKVKYGRTWVNAYRPTLYGMPTNTATTPPTNTATTPPTNTATTPPTNTAKDPYDDYGVDRKRQNTFAQVTNENAESETLTQSLQPEPEPESEPKPKPHSTDGELGFEARQQILDQAIQLSLKKMPTRKPAGDALKAKKRKEFGQLLDRILPTVPQGIIDLFNLNPSCIKAEAFAEYVQCLFEDSQPSQQIKDAIFCDPYPKVIEQLPQIFWLPDDPF
jgi:hypothetical protein